MRHVIVLVVCSLLIAGCSSSTKYYYNKKYLPNVQQKVFYRDFIECKKYAQTKVAVPDYSFIPVPITYNYESTVIVSGNNVITNSSEYLGLSPIGAFAEIVNLAMVAHQFSAKAEYDRYCYECMNYLGWNEITKNEYLHPSPPDPPDNKENTILSK